MAEEQEETQEDSPVVDESVRVCDWRMDELIRAGYPYDLAQVLANCADIDLHKAVDMVKKGCKPHVAAWILL